MWKGPGEDPGGPDGVGAKGAGSQQELQDLKDQYEQQQTLIAQLKEMLRKTDQTSINQEKVAEYANTLTKMNARAKRGQHREGREGQGSKKGETPASEKVMLLRQQLEQNRVKLAERGKSQKGMEEMVTQIKAQLDDSQQQLSTQTPLNISLIDDRVDYTPNTNSQELYNILLNKDKRINELNGKISRLEANVLDLQENIKEKDSVIDARTRAITLMSENLSKKGKTTLDTLDETKEQMRVMQENFVKMEEEMKAEYSKLKLELEEKDREVEDLKVRNEKLTISNMELTKKLEASSDDVDNQVITHLKQRICELEELSNKKVDDTLIPRQLEDISSAKVSDALVEQLQLRINELEELNVKHDASEIQLLQQRIVELEELNNKKVDDSVVQQLQQRIDELEALSNKSEPSESVQNTSKGRKNKKGKQQKQSDNVSMKISELENAIQERDIKITECNKLIEEHKHTIDSLQVEINNLKTKHVDLETTIDKQLEEVKEKEKVIAYLENANVEQVKNLEDTIAQLKKSSVDIGEESPEVVKLKQQLEESNKNMIKVKAQHKGAIKDLKKKIDQFKKIGDLNAAVVRLEGENSKLVQKVAELEEEKGQMQLNMVESKESINLDEVKDLEDRVKEYLEEIANKNCQLATLEHKNEESDSKITEMMEKIEELTNTQNAQIKSDLTSVQYEEQLEKLEAEKKQTAEENERLVQENQNLLEKIETGRKEKLEVTTKLDTYMQENIELLDRLEKLSAEKVSSAESIEIVENLTQQEKLEIEAYQKNLMLDKSAENLGSNLENQDLNESVTQLTEETSELLQKIELFTVERREVMEKMESLSIENNLLNSKLKEIENNRDILVETYEQLQTEKEELDLQLEKLEKANEELLRNRGEGSNGEDVEEYKSLIEIQKQEITELRLKVLSDEDVFVRNRELLEKVAENNELVEDLTRRNQEFELKNAELEVRMKDFEVKVKTNLDEIEVYKTTIEEGKNGLIQSSNIINDLQDKLREKTLEIEHYEKEVVDLSTVITDLNKLVGTNEAKVDANMAAMSEQLEILKSSLSENLQIIEDYESELNQNSATINDLNSNLKNLTNRIVQTEHSLEEKDGEIVKINEEKRALEEINRNLENSILEKENKFHSTCDELKTKCFNLQKQIENNSQSFGPLESKVQALEKKNKDQFEKMKKIAANLKKKTGDYKELEGRYHGLEQKLEQELLERSKLNEELAQKSKLEKQMEEKVKLEVELEEKTKLVNSLQTELQEITKLLEKSQNDLQLKSKLVKKLQVKSRQEGTAEILETDLHQKSGNSEDLKIEKPETTEKLQNELQEKSQLIEKLQSDLQERAKLVKKLKIKLQEMKGSQENSKVIEKLQNQLEEKSKLEEQIMQEKSQLEVAIQKLQTEMEANSSRLLQSSELEHKNADMASEILTYTAQIEDLQNIVREYENQVSNLSNELETFRSAANNTLNQELSRKDDLIADLNSKLQDATAQAHNLKISSDALQMKIHELEMYIETQESELNHNKEKVAKLEEGLSNVEARRKSLENQTIRLGAELREKDEDSENHARNEDYLEQRLKSLAERDAAIENSLKDTMAENQQLSTQNQQLLEQLETVKRQLENAEENLKNSSSSTDKIETLENENSRLIRNLHNVEIELKKASSELKDLKFEREKNESELQEQLEQYSIERKLLMEQFELSREQVSALMQERDDLKSEIADLTQKLDQQQIDFDENIHRSQLLESQLKEKLSELEVVNDRCLHLESERQKAEDAVTRLESTTKPPELNLDISAMQKELDDGKKELQVLRQQVELLEHERDQHETMISMKVTPQMATSFVYEPDNDPSRDFFTGNQTGGSNQHLFTGFHQVGDSSQAFIPIQEIPAQNQQSDFFSGLATNQGSDVQSEIPQHISSAQVSNAEQPNLQEDNEPTTNTIDELNEKIKTLQFMLFNAEKERDAAMQQSHQLSQQVAQLVYERLESQITVEESCPDQTPMMVKVKRSELAASSAEAPIEEPMIQAKKTFLCYKDDIFGESEGWGAEEVAEENNSETNRLTILEEKVRVLELERENRAEELKQAQIKSGKLIKKLKEFKLKNEQLMSKLKSDDFSDLNDAIQDELKGQISTLEKRIKDNNAEMEKEKHEKENLLKRIDVLTSANERMIEMKEKQDIELLSWQHRNRDLTLKLEQLEWGDVKVVEEEKVVKPEASSDNQELLETIKELTLDNEDLQALLEEQRNLRLQAEKALATQVIPENLKSEHEYNLVVAERNALQEQLTSTSDFASENVRIRGELLQVQNRIKELENSAELTQAREELQRLELVISEKEKVHTDLIETKQKLQVEYSQAQSLIEQLRVEHSQAQEKLKETSQQLQCNYSEKTQLEATILENNITIEALNRQLSEIQSGQLESLDNERYVLASNNNELNLQISNMHGDLEASIYEINSLQDELDGYKSEKSNILAEKEKFEQLHAQQSVLLEEAKMEIEQLKASIEQLNVTKASLEKTMLERDELLSSLEQFKRENDKVVTAMESMQEDIHASKIVKENVQQNPLSTFFQDAPQPFDFFKPALDPEQLKAQNEHLSTSLEQLKLELEHVKVEKAGLEQLKLEKEQPLDSMAQLSLEKNQLLASLEELKLELEHVKAEKARLEQIEFQQSFGSGEQLALENTQLLASLEQLKLELEQVKVEKANLGIEQALGSAEQLKPEESSAEQLSLQGELTTLLHQLKTDKSSPNQQFADKFFKNDSELFNLGNEPALQTTHELFEPKPTEHQLPQDVNSLQKLIHEKTNEILQLQNQLICKDAENVALQEAVQSKAHEIDELRNVLLNKETELSATIQQLTQEWSAHVDQRGYDVAESWKLHLESRESEFLQLEQQLRKDLQELESRCKALVDENKELRKNVDDEMRSEVDKISVLQKEIADKDAVISEMVNAQKIKQEEIDTMQVDISNYTRIISELNMEIQELERKEITVLAGKGVLEKELFLAREMLTKAENDLELSQQEVQNKVEVVQNTAESEQHKAEHNLEIVQDEVEEELLGKDRIIQQMQEEISLLKSATEKESDHERLINKLQIDLKEKENDLQECRLYLEDGKHLIDQLKTRASNLELVVTDKDYKINELTEKVQELQSTVLQLQQQIPEYQQQINSYGVQLQENYLYTETLRQELENYKSVTEHVQSKDTEIARVNNLLQEKEREHSYTLETKTLELQSIINDQQQELDVLRRKLEDLDIEHREYIHKMEVYQNEIQETVSKNKIDDSNVINSLVQDGAAKEAKLSELENTLLDDEKQLVELKSIIEEQVVKIEELKQELFIKSNHYDALVAQLDLPHDRKPAEENINEPVNRAELDIALYMLHQRDVRCEELTVELMQLLEERDTLQLLLSNAIREKEKFKSQLGKGDEDDKEEADIGRKVLPSTGAVPKSKAIILGATGTELAAEATESLTDGSLANKLSELKSVGYRKDKTIVDEQTLRRIQQLSILQEHKDEVAKLPPEAAARLVDASYTLSRDVQSPSKVLLNWLWGRSTPKVNNV